MRTLQYIAVFSFSFMVYSCEKEKVSPVITSFPITLVSDTIILQQTEVFNKNGIMLTYDEDYTKMRDYYWLPSIFMDSLVISSPTKAQWFEKNSDKSISYNVIIREDNFQTSPESLPFSMEIVDTRAEGNYYYSQDKEVVKRFYTETFKKSVNDFVIDYYILRIYYIEPGGDPPGVHNYFEHGQLNIIDKKVLYQNLESNEVLVIFNYRANFQIKSDI